MKTIQHKDVIKIFPGVSPRTLINWSEKGLFEPAVQPDGTGSRREYSVYNLVEIGIILELRSFGLSTHAIFMNLQKMQGEIQEAEIFDYIMIIRARRPYIDPLEPPNNGDEMHEVKETILLRKSELNGARATNIMVPYPSKSEPTKGFNAFSALVVDIEAIYEYVCSQL